MADQISKTTRGAFRELLVQGSVVGAITDAFEDEGFAPNPDSNYENSAVRRQLTQRYLESVDWSDAEHVRRFLAAVERLLAGWDPPPDLQRFYDPLRRDGFVVEETTGRIRRAGLELTPGVLRGLRDPSAIREQLDRIARAGEDDPALVINSAKELIESTAKLVLIKCDQPVDEAWDLPKLARQAQEALGLQPGAASGPDGSDGVRRTLGAVTTIANGLAELRNRGHGIGHGPATARVGVRPRHAHLAVNAATTWCQLMLETLDDPDAPWRRSR